jgi:hypothetical protein
VLPSLKECVEISMKAEMALMDSGGEITPEIEQMLIARDLHLPEKIDHYSYRLDMLEAHKSILKEKKAQLDAMIKAYERAEEYMENSIKEAMARMGVEELNGNVDRFRLRKTPGKLIICDEKLISSEYKSQLVTDILDKEKIKEALRIGPVEGARLEISTSLTKGRAK